MKKYLKTLTMRLTLIIPASGITGLFIVVWIEALINLEVPWGITGWIVLTLYVAMDIGVWLCVREGLKEAQYETEV